MPNYGYGKQSRQRRKVYQELARKIGDIPPTPTYLELENTGAKVAFELPINYYTVLDKALNNYLVKAQTLGIYKPKRLEEITRNIWYNRLAHFPKDYMDSISKSIRETNQIQLGENVVLHLIPSTTKLDVKFTCGAEESEVTNILLCENAELSIHSINSIMWHYNYQLNVDKLAIELNLQLKFSGSYTTYYMVHINILAK